MPPRSSRGQACRVFKTQMGRSISMTSSGIRRIPLFAFTAAEAANFPEAELPRNPFGSDIIDWFIFRD